MPNLQCAVYPETLTLMDTLTAQNKATTYSFTNKTPLTGIQYYRIKTNDTNEKSTFSRTISLKNGFILRGPSVYPNPANTVLFVNNADGDDLTVVNTLGQIVLSKKNHDSTPLDMNGWARGVYFLKTIGGVARFVKH